MAQRDHVPKFGNWNNNDIPYTQFFENARKGKVGGKMINPNDPLENPEAFGGASPFQIRPMKIKSDLEVPDAKEGRRKRWEGYNHQQPPPFLNGSAAKKLASGPPQRPYGEQRSIDYQRKQSTVNSVSTRSPEHNLLHNGNKSTSFVTSNKLSKPRMRHAAQGIEMNGKGSMVPKFGEWDESDPSSANSFSHIFNKVREEKQTSSGKIPVISHEKISTNGYMRSESPKLKVCGCFSWGRK